MLENRITVKINKDYRKFKAGETFTIPVQDGITYVTGTNGCGKSTILRALRATNDSLAKDRQKSFEGMVDNRIEDGQWVIRDKDITIETDTPFTHIFSFDAQADDPTSFINAATAGGLVCGGGMIAMRRSRGESTMIQFVRFIRKIIDIRDKTIAAGEAWYPLIIIDEIDEGLDIRMQMTWNETIAKKFQTILCVTHNPICMLTQCSKPVQVYDMNNKEVTTPERYIKKVTGVGVTMDFSEAKSLKEMLNPDAQ
jgi:predicted ATPase